jgi:hypothetical protein
VQTLTRVLQDLQGPLSSSQLSKADCRLSSTRVRAVSVVAQQTALHVVTLDPRPQRFTGKGKALMSELV